LNHVITNIEVTGEPEMEKKQVEKLIHIVEPAGVFVSPQPRVRWIYSGDLHPNTVDVVFVNLKTFKRIRFSDIDGARKEFVPPEALPLGAYEVRVRSGRSIQIVSNNQRFGVVPEDDVSRVREDYSTTARKLLKPKSLNPRGPVHLKDLTFDWQCQGGDIQSFIIQIFHVESQKLVKSWTGIPPSQFALTATIEELQNLSLGKYYWVARAVYFEKDLLSDPVYFKLLKHEDEPKLKDSLNQLGGKSEGKSCVTLPGKVTISDSIEPLPLQQEERLKIIEVSDVSIMFKKAISREQRKTGRSLTSIFKRGVKVEKFWALRDIAFSIEQGEVLGVIGKNGAGKTTLLKILTGVLNPDEGTIQIDGRISALLSLGAGFMPDLSGRENIYLNGMYMGLSMKNLTEIYDKIVDFAELADFIDTQLRYYSSGMKARLGFSVAVHVDPEILIIDEVLGAGDKDFGEKAQKKMREFMEKAKAIVISSHNTKLMQDLCTKCLWLENGSMKAFGPASDVVKEYLAS